MVSSDNFSHKFLKFNFFVEKQTVKCYALIRVVYHTFKLFNTRRQVNVVQEKLLPRTLGELLIQLDSQGITDYRRYKAIKSYLDEKARRKGVPLSGTFELTPLCNLDCKMCYVHLNREQLCGAELLSVQQWKSIIDDAVNAGMMYARLTGGECLSYPGFREIYLHLRASGVETSILSNGVLMNEETVAFFKEHKPAMIQITLYGADEDGYERVTGHRMFSTVMENIRRIQDTDIPLNVVATPSEYMTDGPEIIRLLHQLNVPILINSGLLMPREETGRELHDANLEAYVSMMKLKNQLLGKKVEDTLDSEELPDRNDNGEAVFGVRCAAGRSAFSVDWRGNMKPCNNFPCEGENIFDLGFANAWRHVNETASHYPRPSECEGCRYKQVCKHCVAEHAAGAPRGHASPKICAWGQRMVAEGLLKLP